MVPADYLPVNSAAAPLFQFDETASALQSLLVEMIASLSVEFVSVVMASEPTVKAAAVGEEMVVAWKVLAFPSEKLIEVMNL